MGHPKLLITFSDGNIVEKELRRCTAEKYVSDIEKNGIMEAELYNEAFERKGDRAVRTEKIVVCYPYVEMPKTRKRQRVKTFTFDLLFFYKS